MFGITLAKFTALIIAHGYAIIFPIAVVEGPIIAVFSGFLVSLGYLNFFMVFLVLMAGDMVGDAMYYAIGRWSRSGFLKKWGRHMGASEERIKKLEKVFAEHHWKILAFAKIQAVGSLFLITAGIAKTPFWKFVWYNILGSIPKVLLLELIGFYFGKSYSRVSDYLDYAAIVSFIVLLALYWYVRKRIKTTYKDLGI